MSSTINTFSDFDSDFFPTFCHQLIHVVAILVVVTQPCSGHGTALMDVMPSVEFPVYTAVQYVSSKGTEVITVFRSVPK